MRVRVGVCVWNYNVSLLLCCCNGSTLIGYLLAGFLFACFRVYMFLCFFALFLCVYVSCYTSLLCVCACISVPVLMTTLGSNQRKAAAALVGDVNVTGTFALCPPPALAAATLPALVTREVVNFCCELLEKSCFTIHEKNDETMTTLS